MAVFCAQNCFDHKMCDCDDRDCAAKNQQSCEVAKIESFRDKITGCGAKCKSEKNCQPIKRFAFSCDDTVDRQSFFIPVPNRENYGKCDCENYCGCYQRNSKIIREVVCDQSAKNTDQNHGEPINTGNVFFQLELVHKHGNQQNS